MLFAPALLSIAAFVLAATGRSRPISVKSLQGNPRDAARALVALVQQKRATADKVSPLQGYMGQIPITGIVDAPTRLRVIELLGAWDAPWPLDKPAPVDVEQLPPGSPERELSETFDRKPTAADRRAARKARQRANRAKRRAERKAARRAARKEERAKRRAAARAARRKARKDRRLELARKKAEGQEILRRQQEQDRARARARYLANQQGAPEATSPARILTPPDEPVPQLPPPPENPMVVAAERFDDYMTKTERPSRFAVSVYQRQMGGLDPDGIPGPLTKQRTEQLLNRPVQWGSGFTMQGGIPIPDNKYLAAKEFYDYIKAYGGTNKARIKAYQEAIGVTPDGIYGPKTEARIIELVQTKTMADMEGFAFNLYQSLQQRGI